MSVRKRIWWSRGKRREAWIANYTGVDAKRHIQTFKSHDEAIAFNAKWLQSSGGRRNRIAHNFARQLSNQELRTIVRERGDQ